MEKYYTDHPDRFSEINPRQFVFNMGLRIYTEWCTNEPESGETPHNEYQAEGFEKWIIDETHYAGGRQSFGPTLGRPLPGLDTIYTENLKATLNAAVNRGIVFFEKCPDHKHPDESNGENLRVNLKPYYQRSRKTSSIRTQVFNA